MDYFRVIIEGRDPTNGLNPIQKFDNVVLPANFHADPEKRFVKVNLECSHVNIGNNTKPNSILLKIENATPLNSIRLTSGQSGFNNNDELGSLSLTEKDYYHYDHSYATNDSYLLFDKNLFDFNQIKLAFYDGETWELLPQSNQGVLEFNINLGMKLL